MREQEAQGLQVSNASQAERPCAALSHLGGVSLFTQGEVKAANKGNNQMEQKKMEVFVAEVLLMLMSAQSRSNPAVLDAMEAKARSLMTPSEASSIIHAADYEAVEMAKAVKYAATHCAGGRDGCGACPSCD